MWCEHIHTLPSWHRGASWFDTIFIEIDPNMLDILGINIVQVHIIFSFKFNGIGYQCALVDWFSLMLVTHLTRTWGCGWLNVSTISTTADFQMLSILTQLLDACIWLDCMELSQLVYKIQWLFVCIQHLLCQQICGPPSFWICYMIFFLLFKFIGLISLDFTWSYLNSLGMVTLLYGFITTWYSA